MCNEGIHVCKLHELQGCPVDVLDKASPRPPAVIGSNRCPAMRESQHFPSSVTFQILKFISIHYNQSVTVHGRSEIHSILQRCQRCRHCFSSSWNQIVFYNIIILVRWILLLLLLFLRHGSPITGTKFCAFLPAEYQSYSSSICGHCSL